MSYERVVETKFISTGADKIVQDQQRVGKSFQKAGANAKQGASSVQDWVQRQKTALTLMAAAGAAVMAGIIQSSPILSAALSSTRMAFSLLAMEIGDNVEPVFLVIEEAAWALLDAWDSLDPGTQKVISYFIVLGATSLVLIGAIAGVIAIAASLGIILVVTAAIVGSLAISLGVLMAAVNVLGDDFTYLWFVLAMLGPIGWLILGVLIAVQSGLDALGIECISVSGIFNFLLNTLKTFFNYLIGPAVQTLNGFKQVFTGVFDAIKLVVATIIMAIYFLLTGQFGKMGELFSNFGNKISSIWSGIWSGILNILEGFINGSLFGMIARFGMIGIDMIVSLASSMLNAGKYVKDNFVSGMKSFISWLVKWASGVVGMSPTLLEIGQMILKSLFSGVLDAGKFGKDMIKNFVGGVTGAVKSAGSKLKSAAGKVKKFFSFDLPENDKWAYNSGADMVNFFNKGITQATKSAVSSLSSPASSMGVRPMAALAGGGGGGNKTNTINIGTISIQGGGAMNERKIAQEVLKEIDRREGRR